MKRKIIEELVAWKGQSGRKPLILEGARQVGKSYAVEAFGAEYFDNFLKIDFSNAPEQVLRLFDGEIEPQRILAGLEVFYEVNIVPGQTLLFFDEIQDAPRALTALKYFYERAPEYHIVAAGSLLGVFLGTNTEARASFPVGKVARLKMGPMDFEEFLWAVGKERMARWVQQAPMDELYDEKLADYYREYLMVGGMPEVVQEWVNSREPERVRAVQATILSDYRDDFHKHSNEMMSLRIGQVFDSLPGQFAKNNDKFLYGVIKEGARAREYELAVEWLVNAGIVRRVRRVERGDKIPLKAYEDLTAFKLYFVDVGLFRCLAGIPVAVILEKENVFDEFNGFFAEQFVLQQLGRRELWYWTGAKSEVDFVLQWGEKIIPIEVKSGQNVKAKSLMVYREKYQPPFALRFSLRPARNDDGLINIPLYKIFAWEEVVKSGE